MRTSKSKYSRHKIVRVKPGSCYFCREKEDPSYKDFQVLTRFITDRAKIVGRDRSGVCSKHQRHLAVAVKRARHLGLIAFSVSI